MFGVRFSSSRSSSNCQPKYHAAEIVNGPNLGHPSKLQHYRPTYFTKGGGKLTGQKHRAALLLIINPKVYQ